MPHSVGVRWTGDSLGVVMDLRAKSTDVDDRGFVGDLSSADRADSGEQLVHAEGFDDVVVGAGVEGEHFVFAVGAPG